MLCMFVRESGTVMKQECSNNKEYVRGIHLNKQLYIRSITDFQYINLDQRGARTN